MPYCPESNGERAFFRNSTQEEKIVAEYTRLNFNEINDLNVVDYWTYRRDAVIYNCNQTEKGREYLEKAYYYMQNKGTDKADRIALAEFVN